MTFEEAYAKLEAIVEKMSGEKVGLSEALSLYEEAENLLQLCQKQLTDAEKKIEILLKNRDGTVSLDDSGKPMVEGFTPIESQLSS